MTDQISFNQAFFDACPTGMLAMDQDVRIRWVNPALEKILNLPGDELIGKDKNSLDEGLHALFEETEVLHLSLNGDGERWLHRDVRTVKDGSQLPLRLHFYQDISQQVMALQENQSLRQKVQDLTITDELTSLANARATQQALAVQVTRSRRYGNPLTLSAVRIQHPDGPAARLPDASILAFAHYLRDRLRWADIIGRCEDTLFLLVMPETNQQDAISLLSEIQTECAQGALNNLEDNLQPKLSISARAWEKGDDPQRLTQRTLQALEG